MAVASRLTERSWRGPLGGRRPVWVGLLFFLVMAVGIGALIGDRRHPVLGVVAGLFYAAVFVAVALAGDRIAGWTDRHRAVDSLFLLPFLLFALLAITPWPAWACVAITVGAGGPFLIALAVARRRGTTPVRGSRA